MVLAYLLAFCKVWLRGGGGELPYMGICGPKGYGFSAFLLLKRVSILADFGHFGDKIVK